MVTRTLSLEGAGLVVPLEADDYAALQGGSGFAFPDVAVQWWDGARHGSTYRDTRVLRRTIPLPILVRGRDADHLQDRASRLATILSPRHAPATLRYGQGQEAWSCQVVRTGGGNPVYGEDTNGSTWLELALELAAGWPFWRRERPEFQTVRAGGTGRGLLGAAPPDTTPEGSGDTGGGAFGSGGFGSGAFGASGGGSTPAPPTGTGNSLSRLRLSSGQAMGPVEFDNPGDHDATPTLVVRGPATSLVAQSPETPLETVAWSGTLLAGETLTIDHATGTITDDTGANRYTELGPAPLFWRVPPGRSTGFITLEGVTRDSRVDVTYHPERWLVV